MRLSLTFLLALGSPIIGCQPTDSGPDSTVISSSTGSAEHGSATSGERCAVSEGTWLSGLLACECPPGRLFSTKNGCVSLAVGVTELSDWRCSKVGDLQLEASDCQETTSLQPPPYEEVAHALRGMTVEGNDPNSLVFVNVGQLSKALIDRVLWQGLMGPEIILQAYHQPYPKPTVPDQRAFECRNLISTAFPGASQSTLNLCDRALHALGKVSSIATHQLPPMHAKTIGSGRARTELIVSLVPTPSGNATYRVVGKAGVSLIRTIEVNDNENARLSLLLSPLGAVVGGKVRINIELPDSTEMLLAQKTVYFESAFEAIHEDYEEFGSRRDIQRAVSELMEPRVLVRTVATDGKRAPRNARVRAMVVEAAIDIRQVNLASRFLINEKAAAHYAQTARLQESFFGLDSHGVRKYLDVIVDDPERDADHGTMVASLLVADLPNAKITLMPLGNGSWLGDPRRATQQMIEQVEKQSPQVVNISQNFVGDVGDCRALFAPLFSRFEESVLFVTGAGNDGTMNPEDVCPGSLAPGFPNVVNVAGVDDLGRIHQASNYGAQRVDVAAPFCATVLGKGSNGGGLQRQCGTSFAAPFIANAALRLLAEQPNLRADEVKGRIMASCSADRLDVGCGGRLDVDKLEYSTGHRLPAASKHPMGDGTRVHPADIEKRRY